MEMKKEINSRKTIWLPIYDVEFEITINIQEKDLYLKAAQYVTNRYAAYYNRYRESKKETEIGIITMLDIEITKYKITRDYVEDEKSSKIEKSMDILGHTFTTTICKKEENLWELAAASASNRYSDYADHYKDNKDEHEIILMTLLDLELTSIGAPGFFRG